MKKIENSSVGSIGVDGGVAVFEIASSERSTFYRGQPCRQDR